MPLCIISFCQISLCQVIGKTSIRCQNQMWNNRENSPLVSDLVTGVSLSNKFLVYYKCNFIVSLLPWSGYRCWKIVELNILEFLFVCQMVMFMILECMAKVCVILKMKIWSTLFVLFIDQINLIFNLVTY